MQPTGKASGALRSRILGTGHYVPSRTVTNHDLEKLVDTSDEWIVERTGIRERRRAGTGEASSDMACEASRRALEAAGVRPEEIDLILVATVTPDAPLPSTAAYLQAKLGARPDCPAMDLAAACAGFIYGLSMADHYIAGGGAKHVLVVGVELLSRVLNWEDRTTCVLFGDGAGAAVVGPATDGRGVLSTHIYADGNQAHILTIPAGGSAMPASEETVAEKKHTVHMEGREIFKFAVKSLSSASKTALEHNGMTADQLDWVVPHQANLRILEGVSRRTGVPMERFHLNIERYGNTSSASIPIALDEAVRAGKIEAGQHVLLCALGGGIAWGSALLRW